MMLHRHTHHQPDATPHGFELRSACRALVCVGIVCSVSYPLMAEEVTGGQAANFQSGYQDILAALQRGGLMMWALTALLILATIEGAIQLSFLSRRKHVPHDFDKDVVHVADTKGMDAGIGLCKEKPSSLARVVQAALLRHGAPLGQIENAVRNEAILARYELLRRSRVLGWIAVISPILGLLGCVLNLIPVALLTGLEDGLYCFAFSLVVTLITMGLYFVARARAFDFAHDIEVRALDASVTLDRKARQSIRLIEDIEEKIKTESMIKVPDLSDEFDEQSQPHESALKTNVTTHAGAPAQA